MDFNGLLIVFFWGALVVLMVAALAGASVLTFWFCRGFLRFLRWCTTETYHPRRR
jgi:hypothetical protein